MKFYSYEYVLSQISQQDWVMLILSALLILITAFFALVAVVLISISNFQSNQSTNNQFRNSLHFIEIVSKELGVDKEKIYVNTSATTDGVIIKVGDQFYRALNGSNKDSYLLEKMELYKSDVELVEVKK